jgi:hypothetical protein
VSFSNKDIKKKDNATSKSWGQPDIAIAEPIKENSDKETHAQKEKPQDSSFTKIAPSQPEQKVKPTPNSFIVPLQPKVVTPKMSPSLNETSTSSKTEKDNKKEKEEDKLEEKVVGEKTADFATPPKDDDKEKNKLEGKKSEKANQNKDKGIDETENKDQQEKKVPDFKKTESKEKPKDGEKEKTELDKNVAPKENPSEGQEAESKSVKQEASATEAPAIDSSSSGSVISSLASANPTNFAQGMQIADSAVSKAKQTEKKKAEESLPIIEQPTGLNDTDKQTEKPTIPPEGTSPNIGITESGQPNIIETKVPLPSTPVPSENVKTASVNEPWSPEHFDFRINQLPTTDESLETSPGEKPPVDLSGEASPQQNDSNLKESNSEVEKQKEESDKATLQDFGENNMYPNIKKETLKSQYTFSETQEWQSEKETLPQLSAETKVALDQKIKEAKGGEIEAEVTKQKAGESDYNSKVENEKKSGLEKIDQETQKTRKTQLEEQKKGKDQVNDERENWKEENKKIKQDFSGKSELEKSKTEKDIDSKVKETDQKVDQEYTKAKKDSKEAEDKAQKDVEDKKKEAKEKEKEKSWWDKVTDAISDFFNALKKAVSFIFDTLRKAVKVIIEAAKTLVKGFIELARKFVVGLIKAFAEILKGFVKLALAAFPKLAEKICKAIDKAVEKTVEVINKLAEGLKKVCDFILDSIGKAIDFVLSIYEKVINAILKALEFITVGIIKIMHGIANMVEAIYNSPDHFLGQATEEFLGTDVTQPLPMGQERTQEEYDNLMAKANNTNDTIADENKNNELLSKTSITEDDVSVPVLSNAELSPGMLQYINSLPPGEHVLYEQDGDGTGLSAMQSGFVNSEQSIEPSNQIDIKGGSTFDGDRLKVGPDDKVGPLTTGERTIIVFERIGSAIKKMVSEWWEKNKVYIIAGAVVAALALIAAIILTGGAILGAIPPLLEGIMLLLTVWSLAESIPKIKDNITNYAVKSFNGFIIPGAKHFARAFAIAAMEIIGLIPGAKAGLKGTKSVINILKKEGLAGLKTAAKTSIKTMVKTQAQWGKKVFKTAISGAKKTISKGKYILQGLSKGVVSGFKKVDDLIIYFKKAYSYLKKIRLRIMGLYWQIGIKINPDFIVLMEGKLETRSFKSLKEAGIEGRKTIGKTIKIEGKDALIIAQKEGKLMAGFLNNPELLEAFTKLTQTLPSEQVVRSLSRFTKLEEFKDALRIFEELKDVKGFPKVLKELSGASGWWKQLGAEFVVKYISKYNLKVTALEEVIKGTERVYDAIINGVCYEFKNWEKIIPHKFVEQFMKDVNSKSPFKWVFSDRMKDPNLMETIRTILKEKSGLQGKELKDLLKRLDDLIFIDK